MSSTIKIGVIGKPNVGKSTLFSALTESSVDIANYPFTTIKPNVGIALVKTKCPESEIEKKCNPREGKCVNGTRYVPVEVIDVPGLIPGASEGKGMGNEFLDNIRDSDAIIHVFDVSGRTDIDGNPLEAEISDPVVQIDLIENEMIRWMASRIYRDWDKFARKADSQKEKVEKQLIKKLVSFGVNERDILLILSKEAFPERLAAWKEDDAYRFSQAVFKYIKPIIHLGNKVDASSKELMEKVKERYPEAYFISAEYELAIQKAYKSGLISSTESSFEILGKCTERQRTVLQKISDIYSERSVSRVEDVIENVVKKTLDYIIVFPVYDENHWVDKDGNVLPDAILMRKGSTAIDLAFKVHTDLGEGFIRAIDGRTKRIIGREHELSSNDVIRIISKTK